MTPDREWWKAEAIAEAALPDTPTTKRRVNALADREGWRFQPGKARKCAERGGGWEYHWSVLPVRAQAELIKRAQTHDVKPRRLDRVEAWAAFDELPDAAKAVARDRLAVIQTVEQFEQGMGREMAVQQVAAHVGQSVRTIWNWLSLIAGVDVADRLAYLAPKHRLARRPAGAATVDYGPFIDLLKGDYLRVDGPSLSASYAVASRIATAKGLAIPPERTARRRIDDIPRVTRIFAREGERGLARCFPPQIRDRSQMVAMEGVNADCHKIDVFVLWEGETTPMRPQIVAFQDIYSGKILAWRVDRNPNKVAVMSAFGELVEIYGVPQHCLFDNGMEFANKWLTGGTPTRFRFTVRDDEPLGVLTQLGIKVHWAKPAHGQAKPVERAFRDLADHLAHDPRFAGAYVGHRPDAKPENYMSRAVPLDDFIAVVAEGIEQHNARVGRRSHTCKGRSFDETFAESYASAPIRKATAAQRRLWLMGQEVLKAAAGHGRLSMHKAVYWSEWMPELAGQRVIARFDPEDLNAGVEVYALDGSYLGFAATQEKTEFFNLAAAQEHAALQKRRRRLEKAALEAARPIGVTQVAAELAALEREAPATLPEAKVVEMVQRGRGALMSRAVPTPTQTDEQAEAAMVLRFRQEATAAPPAEAETDRARWARALEIEQRLAADQPVGSAEAQWLYGYQQTPEYRSFQRMVARFGADAIA